MMQFLKNCPYKKVVFNFDWLKGDDFEAVEEKWKKLPAGKVVTAKWWWRTGRLVDE
jgi:hypothetical protein